MMHSILEKLYRGQSLSQAEALTIFGQLITGKLDQISMTALMISLKINKEQPAEIAGAAQALQQHASAFDKSKFALSDSCGTGGSGKHTLNISTLVAFIGSVAGLKMVKHGNRSVSSQCGSADVLEELGVNLAMSPQLARRCLDELGLTFLFAPLYHPGMQHVTPIRKQLKTRTIFNLLGPLINPARPENQLMGVYSPEYCLPAAQSLKLSGCQNAMVVHSCGCDEITLAGATQVAELKNGKIREYQLQTSDFGLAKRSLDAITNRSPAQNARDFCEVLQGSAAQSVKDVVAANAAALLYLSGREDNLKSAVRTASEIIDRGLGFQKLIALKKLSHGHFSDAPAQQLTKGIIA